MEVEVGGGVLNRKDEEKDKIVRPKRNFP